MTKPERLDDLLDLVNDRGTMSISDISRTLAESSATVRRHLTILAERGLVTRSRGGASSPASAYELPLEYTISREAPAKLAIARVAAAMVAPGETVGLNGGTTATEVARAIGRSETLAREDGDRGVTIVTNALNIAYELAVRPNIRIVLSEGSARRHSYELVGSHASDILGSFVLDLAILGVDGLAARFGATMRHGGEAAVGAQFAAVAKRVVIVADSSKLQRSGPARMASLTDIDALVTDARPSRELADALDAAGVELVIAE